MCTSIKLVRTDTIDSCKIPLHLGEHVIGRGKLLECDDKRISRHHGKLEVGDGTLTLRALHQNPCFFTSKGSTEVAILRQHDSTTLSGGDRFGLLPEAFWYEVLLCSEEEPSHDSEKNTEEYNVDNNDGIKETVNQTGSPSLLGTENNDSTEVNVDPSISLIANISKEGEPDNINESDNLNESNNLNKLDNHNKSDNLNESDNCNESRNPNETTDRQDTRDNSDKPDEPTIKNEPISPDKELDLNEQSSHKRSHSPDNSDVKKIKVEVKDESDEAKAGPSLNQGQVLPPAAAAPANNRPNNPLRERCMYGANCYRRRPDHLDQYSHPRDPDWGPGARGVCPYGATCAKTDPRHWRDHEHPPGKLPPPRPGMQVVQRHGNVFYINARSVNFYDNHFQVEDSDGDSVDFDYEF